MNKATMKMEIFQLLTMMEKDNDNICDVDGNDDNNQDRSMITMMTQI